MIDEDKKSLENYSPEIIEYLKGNSDLELSKMTTEQISFLGTALDYLDNDTEKRLMGDLKSLYDLDVIKGSSLGANVRNAVLWGR